MAPRRGLRVMVLTDSRASRRGSAAHGHDIPFFHYGEVLPLALAERTDVCVVLRQRSAAATGCRSLLANLLVAGVPLLDGSTGRRLRRAERRLHRRAAGRRRASPSFLEAEILPNLAQIAEHRAGQPRRGGGRAPRRSSTSSARGRTAARARRRARRRGGRRDRLHADKRHRPRPCPALRADRQRAVTREGRGRSSPPSQAACGW